MEKKVFCNSCNKEILESGATRFSCPSCDKFEIIRCKHCREIAARYLCQNCSFSGPN